MLQGEAVDQRASIMKGVAANRLLPGSSWVLYDFANTIFYAVVVTRYYPEHILRETGSHLCINLGFFPAMLAAAFLAPWLGRYVGRRGFSKRSVVVLTLFCTIATACLGLAETPWKMVILIAVAQVFYQLALVPYNNLLPAVASTEWMGRLSGIGVGAGYAGVIVSLCLVDWLMQAHGGDGASGTEGSGEETAYWLAYLVAAVLFLLFTLPLLFFVPEKKPERSTALPAFKEFAGLLRDKMRRRFIIGNFLCADAMNAVFFFIVVYLEEGFGFDGSMILELLIFLNIAACAGGVASGFAADRFTPRIVMILAVSCLFAAIALAQFSGTSSVVFWSIVLLGGPGVAGIWVAGRKWVVDLSPGGETGAFFGLYGLTNKLSILNAPLFALLADVTDDYLCSALLLLVSLLVGVGFLISSRRCASTAPSSR